MHARTWWTYAAPTALSLALLAGCGGGASDTPATTPAVVPSSAPTSASPAPSTSATPSASASPTATERTSAQLKKALLGIKDVPAGFSVESGDDGGDVGGKASSSRSACAALVKTLNAKKAPGSTADAAVSFSGGQDGPFIDESLAALGTAAAAKDVVAEVRASVKQCSTISLTIDGVGTSPLSVKEISFADVADARFAARFTATGGPLRGFEVIQAGAASGDVLIGMTFVGLDPADAEAAAQDAAAKVKKTLGTSGSV